MHAIPRVAFGLLFASGLAAQYFVERERSMYPVAMPMSGAAGGNLMVIDVDGDGHLDVFAGATAANCYRNDGHGRFTLLAAGLPGGSWVRPQAIGDYNGDGRLDCCTGSNLLINQGSGVFAVDPSISLFTFANVAGAFLDYDGDGDLDWLPNAFGLRLFANNGTGAFTEVTASVLAGFNRDTQDFRVADLDGDGDDDVVKCGGGFGPMAVNVWRNQGLGVFVEETLPAPGGLGAFSAVDVADFDGDGLPDIALAGMTGSAGATIGAWLIDGAPGSWTMLPMSVSSGAIGDLFYAEPGDWNGDGRADWAVRSGIYVQTGALQFALQPFPFGTLPGEPMLVDLDGDGRLDVIAPGGRGFLRNSAAGLLSSEQPWVALPTNPYGTAQNVTVGQVDARRRSSVTPIDDVVVSHGSGVLWGSNEPLPGDHDRTLRLRSLSGWGGAQIAPAPGGAAGILTRSPLAFFEVMNGMLVPASAPVPPVPPTHMQVADLDGQPGDEVVFGSSQQGGPMIFGRSGTSWVDRSPAVQGPGSTTALTHEQILLADVDGDGDRDIVHKSRWLRNDAGTWNVAAMFHTLVHTSSRCIAAVDCDRDGDLDIFLGAGAGYSRLLRNTPTGFVNASATWLPPGLAEVTGVTAADVDGDGATDLLLVIGNRSLLLRNAGVVFTMAGDVGPVGVLVDLNHDDRLDLFTGSRIFWNNEALLWSPGPALLGSWALRFESRSQSVPYMPGMLLLSHGEATTTVPGIGTFYIDHTSFAAIDVHVFSGQADLDLPIPTSPVVLGLPLRGQLLAFDGQQFLLSNLVRDYVH